MSNSFENKTKAFEKAIGNMQADLQWLANKRDVKDTFVAKQNRILKSLIDYYNESQQLISTIKNQLTETQIANNR